MSVDVCPEDPCERAREAMKIRLDKVDTALEVLGKVGEIGERRDKEIKEWLTFAQQWLQGQKQLVQ